MARPQISLGSTWALLLLGLACLQSAESLIVPQELPSILSLVYSNIPQIRKGTDSRLGFGFRLGDHADFQVMLELGPQKETKPVGDQDSGSSFNKRQVSKHEQRKALLRLQQQHQQRLREQQELQTSTERAAASWLESWSKDMLEGGVARPKKPTKATKQGAGAKKGAEAALPTRPAMPQQALRQLQLLYKMATTEEPEATPTPTAISTSTSPTSTTTTPKPFAGGPLNLGGPAGFAAHPAVPQSPSNLLELLQPRKTKAEITKELMDVSLATDE